MTKETKCRRHKYICKKIETFPSGTDFPLECKFCGKIYFTDSPLVFKTASLKTLSICAACQRKLHCVGCKQKFTLEEFFVGECIRCGDIKFYCRKCSKKLPTLPLGLQLQEEVLRKMQALLKDYMPEIGDSLPKNLKDLKKFKGIGDIPGCLFLYFNIILPSDFSEFNNEEEDDADWWKK